MAGKGLARGVGKGRVDTKGLGSIRKSPEGPQKTQSKKISWNESIMYITILIEGYGKLALKEQIPPWFDVTISESNGGIFCLSASN